jgi:hypothetical protein
MILRLLSFAPRVLPHVVSQRSRGEVRVAEVRLHHFEAGDPCEHRGRPEAAPIIFTSLVLLMLPRLYLRLYMPVLTIGAVANGLHGLQGNSDECEKTDILDDGGCEEWVTIVMSSILE